jgi:hypothetical protein
MTNLNEARVRELEAENERLREEVERANADGKTLLNALLLLAPEYVVTEAEMQAIMADPVPFAVVVEEAERAAGIAHVP